MIVITGAAGFIGSNLVSFLLKENYLDLVLVDDFPNEAKFQNLKDKRFREFVTRDNFADWLDINNKYVQFIFHIGARTDTAEFDTLLLERLNTEYTKMVWNKCVDFGIALVYCSSAATYGSGELGFDDNTSPESLSPLNPYGVSKNEFDKWAIKQEKKPYFWAGLKFFNVYGPNEYHKTRMASVIYHAYNQIKDTGSLKLFRSHIDSYADGQQIRDFIYVKDVLSVMYFLMLNRQNSGIYNVGTGQARSFNDLGNSVFKALNLVPNIVYVDIPDDIRDKYQYYTQANIQKIRDIGYTKEFYSLEQGVFDYVRNYLASTKYE